MLTPLWRKNPERKEWERNEENKRWFDMENSNLGCIRLLLLSGRPFDLCSQIIEILTKDEEKILGFVMLFVLYCYLLLLSTIRSFLIINVFLPLLLFLLLSPFLFTLLPSQHCQLVRRDTAIKIKTTQKSQAHVCHHWWFWCCCCFYCCTSCFTNC